MYYTEDNNYFEFDNYNNIDFKMDDFIYNRDSKLYSIDEGFNKGNMFKNLYVPYKNYIYKLKVSGEKDKLLYNIQAYTFALKDINLYLDTNPNDKEILNKYKEYKKTLENLKYKYINTYGPICTSDVTNSDKWTWINNPWPWDKGGN